VSFPLAGDGTLVIQQFAALGQSGLGAVEPRSFPLTAAIAPNRFPNR
jgi:hypothetical protein